MTHAHITEVPDIENGVFSRICGHGIKNGVRRTMILEVNKLTVSPSTSILCGLRDIRLFHRNRVNGDTRIMCQGRLL